MNKLATYTFNFKQAFVYYLLILICSQLLTAVIALPGYFYPELNFISLPLSFAVGFGSAIVLAMFIKKLNIDVLKAFFTHHSPWIYWGIATILYLCVLPIAEYLSMLVPTDLDGFWGDFYNDFEKSFEVIFKSPISAFITICILAPILEELIFRGLLLRGLLNNKKVNPWLAILFIGVLFGITHGNPWQALGAGTLGIVFGYIYWRTKDLVLCMFLHFLNNSIGFIVTIQSNSMEETLFEPNYFLIAGSLIFTAGIGLYLYQLTQNKKINL